MPTEIKLPRLGQGMDEGKILKWLKAEGDTVTKGEEIYEVETEKVNIEVEAPADGTLLKIVVGEGQEVPIGTVIGYLGDKGEAVPDAAGAASNGTGKASADAEPEAKPEPEAKADGEAKAGPDADTPTAKPTSERTAKAPHPPQLPERQQAASDKSAPATDLPAGASATSGEASSASSDEDDRIKASPLARRMAHERGIELSSLSGTGPEGRIVARDVEGAEASDSSATGASPRAAVAGGERVELTSMRRTIARRLTEAWQAPAFYLTVDIDMEQANTLRERLVKTMADGDVKPTVSDVIMKACAAALRRHPDMNVHFAGDAIVRFSEVHVGMAVATEQGLVVPVVRDVHTKSVREIAADRKALVDKSRSGKLRPEDFEGGTFTISNLGMMGIDEFTAVLNPPMAGILAIGQTRDKVVAVNRKMEIRPRMTVTLGCDHRAVDGAVGARFLATVKSNLEDPLTMI